ncbi:hypothetical protein FGL86_05700 [Pistricoccus aurantiacus]|uniref:Lipoprotein n=1 Tax=Pistricoccus aurantiacus TaxID=1883414 RepID=A0A5B8SNA7_9GAMM|nr:hypothetical protein [Pistricoccus aurantiacus]QEA38622.1 hypothetical protein FGL86_05700 [Pistricoccus aurantiacus]
MQRTTPIILGIGLLTMALLAGCAAQDHYYTDGVCVTCINNPITGEPLNYDPDETPQQVATNAQGETVDTKSLGSQSGSIDIDSPVDVDTAYARIKPAMGFRSPDDFEKGNTMSKWKMGDSAWKHQVTPGAYYNLGDYGSQVVGGTRHSILQRVQIQKDGAGSRIHYSWAPAGPVVYDGGAMEAAIKQRLEAALR